MNILAEYIFYWDILFKCLKLNRRYFFSLILIFFFFCKHAIYVNYYVKNMTLFLLEKKFFSQKNLQDVSDFTWKSIFIFFFLSLLRVKKITVKKVRRNFLFKNIFSNIFFKKNDKEKLETLLRFSKNFELKIRLKKFFE